MSENELKSSDTELVQRIQAGDDRAFDEIDRRYRDVLCRFLLRFSIGPEQAEEFGQRTLIRAFQTIGQLRSAGRLAGWLHRIAFRIAVAEGRRRNVISLDSLVSDAPGRFEPSIDEESPLEGEEKSKNLWQIARRELSKDEFEVLTLRYRDELPLPQIARAVGQTEGTVRVRLHRARKKLLPFFHEVET